MYYILHGNDSNRMKQKLASIKQKHDISQVLVFDCNSSLQSDILAEMDSYSIFDEKKMLVLENATFLSSKDGTGYDVNAFIKRQDDSDTTIVVFSCPSEKLDKRKKAVKEMIAASTVLSCLSLDDHSKREYVMNLCKEKQVQFDRDAFRWFLTRVGNDPLRIENEIEKCSIYASHITLEDVVALVAPEPMDNVFKMVDALFNRNALLLLSYYRNFRALNMEPLAIVGLLASQIRFLFQVRVCMEQGLSKNEIAQELHAHPYRVQVNQERAYDFDLDQLLDQLVQLATFDQEMKMGMVDKDEGFEQFVLRLLIEN